MMSTAAAHIDQIHPLAGRRGMVNAVVALSLITLLIVISHIQGAQT
jgi:hypothetical protein